MFHKIILKETLEKALKDGVVCLRTKTEDDRYIHSYVTKNVELIESMSDSECISDIELDEFVFDVSKRTISEFRPELFSGEVFPIALACKPDENMFLVNASIYMGNFTGPVCASERLLKTIEGVEIDFKEIGIEDDTNQVVFDIVMAFEEEKSEIKSQLKGIYLLKEKGE